MNVKERALRIGAPTPLVAVASEPSRFDSSRPALIVLNSGVMHHVGACRLSVKIARAAAANDFLAVRFDYSGIGDSEPRRGSAAFEEVALKECAEVMDFLQRTRGVQRFVLYGLCSGADAAYFTALVDERVVGIAQIDAFCYANFRYHLEHYRKAIFRSKRWASLARRTWAKLTGSGKRRSASEAAGVDEEFFEVPSYVRVFPPREQVAGGLTKLIRRGVHMYVIFTGGEPHYNHRSQYRSSFSDVPFGQQLTVDYFPETNHIITQANYQKLVVERIAAWMGSHSHRAEVEPTLALSTAAK